MLIDPVDMTGATRRMGYPSAVEALRGKGARAALIGEAGRGGRSQWHTGLYERAAGIIFLQSRLILVDGAPFS